MDIYDLVQNILALKIEQSDEQNVKNLKREYCKINKLAKMPTNIQILKAYSFLLDENKVSQSKNFENLMRKRGIRSQSGIVPVQVLTKPYTCPGQCIFCPNDKSMPKSYINTEPGAMRAMLNDFDPIQQVYNRLLSLKISGHDTDKIEMIVLGGSFDAYPMDYKIDFVKSLFDACNTFDEFAQTVKLDDNNPKAMKYTFSQDNNIKYSDDLSQAQEINETANHKIIGLTIETRPDFVSHANARFWRELGVTRIEMGVQSLFDDVLKANKRGTSVEQIQKSVHILRQYGFKFSFHFMPGLYQSSIEKDLQTMQKAYDDIFIKPDEIKFYPTSVIPNTELCELYLSGKYKPLESEEISHIIQYTKLNIIPPYTRLKRVIRDIPETEIVAGSKVTNLRQEILSGLKKEFEDNEQKRNLQYKRLYPNMKKFENIEEFLEYEKNDEKLKDDEVKTYIVGGNMDLSSQRNFVCLCTRCREIRNKELQDTDFILVIRKYLSSVGKEYFISYEDSKGYLYGFARLLLPDIENVIDYPGLGKNTAIIRELHVYGQLAKISEINVDKTQHQGFGTRLMQCAENISQINDYKKLSVISGIGVRAYYQKIGYILEGTYMTKNLHFKKKGVYIV